MKNLKIYKTALLLSLSGIVLTGCNNCSVADDHLHVFVDKDDFKVMYESCEKDIEDYSCTDDYILNNDLGSFMVSNNIYKLSDVKSIIVDRVNSDNRFVESLKLDVYHKKSGKIAFKTHWSMLDSKEIKSFTAIGREGNREDIKYIVYKINKDDDSYELVSESVSSLDNLGDDYYVDFDHYITLDVDEMWHFKDGKKCVRER